MPPGGPEDRRPPRIIATEPDTFATVRELRRPAVFQFDERISERVTGGSLDAAVVVSPRTGDVRVHHRRRGLAVEFAGGFREGLVYRITLLPRIQDMFGNRMAEPFELVFSTGAALSPAAVAGQVTDRITGNATPEVTVDALADDGTVYTARTDTAGIFAMRFIPPGDYRLAAYLDRNRNGEPDGFEARDTATLRVGPADTVVLSLALLEPDTTPAVLARVVVVDSVSLRLSFDDHVAPKDSLETVAVRLTSGDTVPPPRVRRVLHAHEFEAARRAVAAVGQRDTAAAAVDTVAPAAEPAAPARAERPGGGVAREAPADTGRVAPEERPRPGRELVAVLESALRPGALYDVEVTGVRNINGVPGGGGRAAVEVPERPPADTAAPPRRGLR